MLYLALGLGILFGVVYRRFFRRRELTLRDKLWANLLNGLGPRPPEAVYFKELKPRSWFLR